MENEVYVELSFPSCSRQQVLTHILLPLVNTNGRLIVRVYLGEGTVLVFIVRLLILFTSVNSFFREWIMRHSAKLSALIKTYRCSGSYGFTKDLIGQDLIVVSL